MKRSPIAHNPSRIARAAVLGTVFTALSGGLTSGCLDRKPVESHPNTTNVFVEQIVLNKIDKIDLLFAIDNSVSMADKQQILASAVPALVDRFVDPICVNELGIQGKKNAGGSCQEGFSPEFAAVNNIHIGVVSSSLGGHGGAVCLDGPQNDRGELIAPLRIATIPDASKPFVTDGFLNWTAETIPQRDQFRTAFTDVVKAVGESGCGYEATLESWYRFLIDPEPPADVVKEGSATVVKGVDATVLNQRALFLRPDSLVAIIALSDENDCSLRDDGYSWLVGDQGTAMPKARAICNTNPNDPCCRACADSSVPASCGADDSCKVAADKVDNANLRCWDQKKRFGLDLLYPTARYVAGLRDAKVYDRSGKNLVPNPLYTKSANPAWADVAPRDSSGLVYFATIVGVPWQDVATDDSLGAGVAKLQFKRSTQLDWSTILGDPANNVKPKDPFMIEQIDPRSGSNPATGEAIQPANSPGWTSKVNGHDYTPKADRGDLQFACIFPLSPTRDCATLDGSKGCDCRPDKAGALPFADLPLCQKEGATAVGTTQYFAKAYPGTRFLEVAKGFGDNSIVASICPKDIDPNSQYYGYNPAVSAIVDRLKDALKGTCLPRALQVNPETNELACQVVEATNPGVKDSVVNCGLDGRSEVDEAVKKAVRKKLAEAGRCDGNALYKCNEMRLCKLPQAEGTDVGTPGYNCLQVSRDNPGGVGYCYIDQDPTLDESQRTGNPDIVAKCPESQKRLLRFISDPGHEVPYSKSYVMVACLGQSITTVK